MSIRGAPSHLSRRAAITVGIAVALACAFSAGRLPMLRAVEDRLLDWRLRAPHPSPSADEVLVAAIEASTLEELKTSGYVLDRSEYVKAIEKLSEDGARVIALDIYLGEAGASEADAALAEAIEKAGNVILVADAEVKLAEGGGESIEFTPPADEFTTAARAVASPLLARPQHVVREVQPVQQGSDDTAYTALAFEVYRRVRAGTGEQAGPLLINWAGQAGSVARVKLQQVNRDSIESSRIAGRAVFIGVTEEQKDLFATPVGPMSGVEIHAQAAATMLAGAYIARTSHTGSLLAGLALCVVLAAFAVGRRAWWVLLGAGVLAGAWVMGGYLVFRARALAIPMTGTAVSPLVCGVLLSVLQSERVVSALSRLWPSWVARPEGEEIEATVLVCDMAGYTARSEQARPGEMMALMRGFFGMVDEVVGPHGGVLARRPGDAAIVFFRPEQAGEHHTTRGVEAALALRERLERQWEETDLSFGITLTTGTVSLGFVGTSPPEPQILGDPVNVAFRLQSETRRLGEAIIVDWPTASGDPETARRMRPLGQVEVRNRREPVQLFAPAEEQPTGPAGSDRRP